MDLSVRSPWKGNRCLKLANLALFGFGGLLALGMLLFSLCYPWELNLSLESNRALPSDKGRAMPYEAIGSGALELNPSPAWGWMTHLIRELVVLAHNSRPDVKEGEAKILLALSDRESPFEVESGKTLFLEEEEASKQLAIAKTPQSLWIKPILLDNGRVLIETGKKWGHLNSSHGHEEKGQFIVSEQASKKNLAKEEAFAVLRKGRGWGKDLLMQQYGGGEFASWRDRYKIEIPHGAGSYVLYVMQGDYLQWKDGVWTRVDRDRLLPECPVAMVQAASARGIELMAWNETGFDSMRVELPLEAPSRLTASGELIPSHLKLRTASQVSCLFGKKRMWLRPGDWVVKTATGWKGLRRQEELENCLHHRLRGELFIVDGLTKEAGNRWMLKGTLFNEMRTEMHPVSIPVESENRSKGKR